MIAPSHPLLRRPWSTCAPGWQRRIILVTLIVAAALTLATAFQARARTLKKARTGSTSQINDFERWTTMVPEFVHGRRDYLDDKFPTPPVTLLVLWPVTALPPATAQFVWVCCKGLLAGGIFWFCWALVRRAGADLTPLALLLIALAWLWPVTGDMQEGQTNLLMLLPLAAGLYFAQGRRAVDPWLAGVLIALAICIKVTPLIFLAYMLWRRQWKISLGIVMGIGLWLLVVPALAFGWAQNIRWLDQWFHIMILPYVQHGTVVYASGQSLPSYLTRFLSHVPAFETHYGGQDLQYYVNVLDLEPGRVRLIIRAVLLLLGAGGIWWMRHPLPALRCRRYLLEIAVVGVFMLWASERTWVTHYVSTILALFAVGMVASAEDYPRPLAALAGWALLLAVLAGVLTTDAAKIFGRNGNEYMRCLGVSLWSSALLVLVLVRAGQTPPASTPLQPGITGPVGPGGQPGRRPGNPALPCTPAVGP